MNLPETHKWKIVLPVCDELSGEWRFEEVVRIFHRWIREERLQPLLIDVADYTHMWRGPGIKLVAHEANYSLGTHHGRLGLAYQRKRPPVGATSSPLAVAVRDTLEAARLLEQELPALRFSPSEVVVSVLDRLRAPNDATTQDAIAGALNPVFCELFSGPVGVRADAQADARQPLTVHVRSPGLDRLRVPATWLTGSAGV